MIKSYNPQLLDASIVYGEVCENYRLNKKVTRLIHEYHGLSFEPALQKCEHQLTRHGYLLLNRFNYINGNISRKAEKRSLERALNYYKEIL